MTGFLLDTNCISEINRPKANQHVVAWFNAADEGQLFLSVLVLGEIRKGATLLAPSARRRELEQWLDADLPRRFNARILPVDAAIAYRWGIITAEARIKGITLSTTDGLLAATALEHNLTLVTRNVKDYGGVGVDLLNPWDYP